MSSVENVEYLDNDEFKGLSVTFEVVLLFLVKANRADSGAPRYVNFFFSNRNEADSFEVQNQCLGKICIVESRFDDSICMYYIPDRYDPEK